MDTAITGQGNDLVTYNAAGQVVRTLSHTETIDGVPNCINQPVLDKGGDLYGFPYGQDTNGAWRFGDNLLAYDGNVLKWKYPIACGSNDREVVVGADGNIYATTYASDGVHLIGLTPEVAAGQSQPAKVLDVDIPDDCSIQLYAYKGGIMLHGQSSGNARYYSYSGNYLGQATIGDVWYEKINASGQLFVGHYVSGSFTSASVSMYDPFTDKVVWTASASTSGANVRSIRVFPLTSGGVLARIREQKMTSDGVPASPEEYVDTLVTINAAGQKVRSTVLPNQNGDLTFANTYVIGDSSGKAVVMRNVQVPTQVSWPSTVPAIAIGVYNPGTGSWDYQEVMQGDATSNDPYGFFNNMYSMVPLIANDTVFVTANCSGDCNSVSNRLYAVQVTGLGMDYPRGAVLTTPPLKPYVALGDSFSSGEGVAPFEEGTDVPDVNVCHRSHYAYARLADRSTALSLTQGSFAACSGAETRHIKTDDKEGEQEQITHLNASTKVATITIGGNDVLFKEFAIACVNPASTCRVGSNAYNASRDKLDNALPNDLRTTYRAILGATSNDAQIYVLGYPHVAPVKDYSDPWDARCPFLYDSGFPEEAYRWQDAQAARDIVDRLNGAISGAVNAVRNENPNNSRLHFVDANGSGSPFEGHEMCSSGASYFQNLDQWPSNNAAPFHPNDAGQAAYAELALDKINAG